jgi:quinol monooxygenase YgiN
MVFNNVLLRAKDPQRVTEISGLLRQQASLSSVEPGCERFDVYQSEAEPELFLLIEVWASEGHLAQHRKAEAFTQLYQPKVLPLVHREPHLCRRIWPSPD